MLTPKAPRLDRPAERQRTADFVEPAGRPQSFGDDGNPVFLGEQGYLSAGSDWQVSAFGKLWLYNLHYFDDLHSASSHRRTHFHKGLIDRWIEENPPAHGVGWEPYPTSLRIVNWIKWLLRGNDSTPAISGSLARQADWLSRNIEWHLLGNHLFVNAKALVFAGLFFSGPVANRWLHLGTRIIDDQIDEQFLGDGGQFERSPMYHSLALEDLLDLLNVASTYPGVVDESLLARMSGRAASALKCLSALTHPDGQIALLNDSAFDVAPTPRSLREYAKRLGIAAAPCEEPIAVLEQTGYVSAKVGPALLIADVGDVGPDYLPGHAHADTLSFELSLLGQRWIVDSGCSTYEIGDERSRQRGTAAHNTVFVDGQNSSDVWSSFRVGRRARGHLEFARRTDAAVTIAAYHDGYARVYKKQLHHRTWVLEDTSLTIEDTLSRRYREATARFHLHPDIAVVLRDGCVRLSTAELEAVVAVEHGRLSLEDSRWHPKFGAAIPNKVIAVDMEGSKLTTKIRWSRKG